MAQEEKTMIEKQTVQVTLTSPQNVPMKRGAALPVVAILALVILCGAIARPGAYQTPQPGTILTVAGNGTAGFSGDGGPATQAALKNPLDQTVDASGNLFFADTYNNRVRKVSPDGTITTVVGTGKQGSSGDGGPATQARLNWPNGVQFDAAGNLFVGDVGGRVRKVDRAGIITTVVKTLSVPQQIALDPQGNLYAVEFFNHRVRKVDPNGIITTVVGSGHPADGRGDGGLATEARLYHPWGVALDRLGNLYVADFPDGRVRKVGLDGKISTVAGGGQPPDGVGDGGPATEARLEGPGYITLDSGGNLFIAENRGERIRKVNPAGIITTVAGTGQIGHTGDGGMATAAQLNSPESVAVDRAGNLYFTEGDRYAPPGDPNEGVGNYLVREVIGVAVPQ
jgi:sugar lactone lactonase YvrE